MAAYHPLTRDGSDRESPPEWQSPAGGFAGSRRASATSKALIQLKMLPDRLVQTIFGRHIPGGRFAALAPDSPCQERAKAAGEVIIVDPAAEPRRQTIRIDPAKDSA